MCDELVKTTSAHKQNMAFELHIIWIIMHFMYIESLKVRFQISISSLHPTLEEQNLEHNFAYNEVVLF